MKWRNLDANEVLDLMERKRRITRTSDGLEGVIAGIVENRDSCDALVDVMGQEPRQVTLWGLRENWTFLDTGEPVAAEYEMGGVVHISSDGVRSVWLSWAIFTALGKPSRVSFRLDEDLLCPCLVVEAGDEYELIRPDFDAARMVESYKACEFLREHLYPGRINGRIMGDRVEFRVRRKA